MDVLDQASAVEGLERELAVAEQAARAEAVRRAGRGPLFAGGVALCRRCGEEIAPARVRAVPWAETCVECARGEE